MFLSSSSSMGNDFPGVERSRVAERDLELDLERLPLRSTCSIFPICTLFGSQYTAVLDLRECFDSILFTATV